MGPRLPRSPHLLTTRLKLGFGALAGGAGTPGPSARLWRFSDHPRGVGDVVDGTGVVELAGGDDGADRAGSFLALAGAEAAGESKEGGKLAGCQTCAHDPRNGVWT